jgi:hypothetical protein
MMMMMLHMFDLSSEKSRRWRQKTLRWQSGDRNPISREIWFARGISYVNPRVNHWTKICHLRSWGTVILNWPIKLSLLLPYWCFSLPSVSIDLCCCQYLVQCTVFPGGTNGLRNAKLHCRCCRPLWMHVDGSWGLSIVDCQLLIVDCRSLIVDRQLSIIDHRSPHRLGILSHRQ